MVEVALVRRELLGLGAVREQVAHADGKRGEGGEDVELREGQRRHAVQADGEAQPDQVEPAAAALPARDGADLAAELLERCSWSGPSISVGNGPAPTRVTYAFATPMTESMRVGPIPVPTAAPPATVGDEVTKGYVP